MAEFKLTISDPKTGKTYQKEVKDQEASVFLGLNIGENVNGDSFGMGGYELQITGGSDHCGFPMRSGILGLRKRISLYGGVGFSGKDRKKRRQDGLRRKKTVCGHKIHEKITQINLKITKEGGKKPVEIFGENPKDGEAKGEEKPKEAKQPAEKPHKEPKKQE